MARILMALSGARHWTLTDGTKHPTGFWAEEFLVPYTLFTDAGHEVVVATPSAVRPVVDELSLGLAGGLPWTTKNYREQLDELGDVLDNTADLHQVDPDDYDLLFYPGGHGPMEDLAIDITNGRILTRRLESGRPLAMLCHSPAAVLATIDADGRSPFAGRTMTGLSNREERFNSFSRKAPWLLEDRLRALGVRYEKGLVPYRPFVVVDQNLFSGQNPQSSKKLATTVLDHLER